MSYFPYRVSLTLIKASCCTIILPSYYFRIFHAGYKCQNTLSLCIFMGFIATERTHAVACGKGNLVLGGLPSPALPTIPRWPQSCGNWGRSIVSVIISQGSEPISPVFQFWVYGQLASTLDCREADMVVLKYLFFHPPHLPLLNRTMISFRYLSVLFMIRWFMGGESSLRTGDTLIKPGTFKAVMHHNHLERLWKHRLLNSSPRDPDPRGLGPVFFKPPIYADWGVPIPKLVGLWYVNLLYVVLPRTEPSMGLVVYWDINLGITVKESFCEKPPRWISGRPPLCATVTAAADLPQDWKFTR